MTLLHGQSLVNAQEPNKSQETRYLALRVLPTFCILLPHVARSSTTLTNQTTRHYHLSATKRAPRLRPHHHSHPSLLSTAYKVTQLPQPDKANPCAHSYPLGPSSTYYHLFGHCCLESTTSPFRAHRAESHLAQHIPRWPPAGFDGKTQQKGRLCGSCL